MKTKIVYVIVSSAADYYLEQAYVSMMSLKRHNPDSHIVAVIDSLTAESLDDVREKELSLADERVVIDLDKDWSANKRSRFLKTNVRKYVDGNFLYIDTDTVVVGRLDDIDNVQADVAAVYDCHVLFAENPYREMNLKLGKELGWNMGSEREFFNSGAVYVKDNDVARNLYAKWHSNWAEGIERGVNMDQPSFAKSNAELDHVIKPLSAEWNCQLPFGYKYLSKAKVVHYLWTSPNKNSGKSLFALGNREVLDKIKSGEIPEIVYRLIDNPFEGICNLTMTLAEDEARTYSKYRRSIKLLESSRFLKLCFRLRRAFGKLMNIFR